MQFNADLIDLLRALNDAGAEYHYRRLRICRARANKGDERPNRIEVITTIDGVAFDEAWSRRVTSTYAGLAVHYIGLADLITNKKAANRPQDRADVAYLREANNL